MILDRARRALLFITLILLTIPGFKGLDLKLGPLPLGRFQPFKFLFMIWLVAQTSWVVLHYKEFLTGQFRTRRNRTLSISSFSFFLTLALGLLVGDGGPRGWNIFLSLALGATAATVTLADQKFPISTAKKGLIGATVILLVFAFLERLFPQNPFVFWFLSSVRDGEIYTFQTGSTLTPSALAEFCIRTLPIFLPVLLIKKRSTFELLTCVALSFLLFLTLTRGSLLAWFAMAGFLLLTLARRNLVSKSALIKICALASVGAISLLLWMGPNRVLGRYFGWMIPGNGEAYSVGARNSANERYLLAKAAWVGITHEPWTGIGLDGFAYRLDRQLPPFNGVGAPSNHTHNVYLELAVSGGVLALVAFLTLMGSAGYLSLSPFLNLGSLLYLVGVGVSNLFDCRIYVSWLAITFFWFGALAWRSGLNSPEK